MERRTFMKFTAASGAALMLHPFESFANLPAEKIRLALVGTGSRGSSLWGKDMIQFLGALDSNQCAVQIPCLKMCLRQIEVHQGRIWKATVCFLQVSQRPRDIVIP